jgi:protein-tyrosine-phosphatase
MSDKPKVLIVCLGNICRSPMGEAVLAHVAKERGIDVHVESAGTAGYHTGEEPDERSVQLLDLSRFNDKPLSERTVAICKKV